MTIRNLLFLIVLIFSRNLCTLVLERFHRCYDEGEAYSAAYLVKTAYLLTKDLSVKFGEINTELATFIMIETDTYNKFDQKRGKGKMFMSADVFDFSVIHLSAYERSMREVSLNDVDGPFVRRLRDVGDLLMDRYKRRQNVTSNDHRSRTLVVMPWFGSAHSEDAGHSTIDKRLTYLKASFYSIAAVFPAVVIGVANEADRSRVLEELLPALDVLVIPRAQEYPRELPLLIVKEVQRRLSERQNGWNERFQYLFFTESDQLLMIRDAYKLFEQLESHPLDVIMPHRLIPYSHELLLTRLRVRGLHTLPVLPSQPLANTSIRAWECRITTAACSGNRSEFVPIRTLRKWSTLPLLNIDGLLVVFGHSNYRRHLFRPCQLQRKAEAAQRVGGIKRYA